MSVPPGAAGGSVSPQSCLSLSLLLLFTTNPSMYSLLLPSSVIRPDHKSMETDTHRLSSPPSSSLTWGADVSINTITAAVTHRQSHERTEEAVHTRKRPFSSDKRSKQAPLSHGEVTGPLGYMWTDWGMLVTTRFEVNSTKHSHTYMNCYKYILYIYFFFINF